MPTMFDRREEDLRVALRLQKALAESFVDKSTNTETS